MENQRLGAAGGEIFYVTWSTVEYDIIEEALMEIEIPFYSHPETHKDPVGTALHIQEANMDDTTQTKTHTERAAAGYMTTEKRAKRARFPETSVFIADVEDHETFLK
ncbi:hypothetical protein TNCV_1735621 [Trichonephila clavipes]|nr:hypothetical protein TNCV_1735621 [Trichonephila clavipes]